MNLFLHLWGPDGWFAYVIIGGSALGIIIDQFVQWRRRRKEDNAPVKVPVPHKIGPPITDAQSNPLLTAEVAHCVASLVRSYRLTEPPGAVGSAEWLHGLAKFIEQVSEEAQHADFVEECAPEAERPKVLEFRLPRHGRNPHKTRLQKKVDEYMRTLEADMNKPGASNGDDCA